MASTADKRNKVPSKKASDTTPNATETKKGTKKGGSRGSSFTPTEDESIAKAWISASEDPIVGTEQKGNDFYTSIQNLYNEKFKPVNRERRSMESIKNRCRAIHKECMIFCGCHSRVIRSHPTGVSPSDILNMATALYNGVDISNATDDCGKPFRFLGAWQKLRRHDKFVATVECKGSSNNVSHPKEASNTEVIDIEEGSGQSEYKDERPIGRKRAKEARQKQDERAKKLRLAAKSVAAQKERNKSLNRHYEIMLFTNAPSGCNGSEAVEYFNIMRARALKELREQEKKNAANSVNDNQAEQKTAPVSGDKEGDEDGVANGKDEENDKAEEEEV